LAVALPPRVHAAPAASLARRLAATAYEGLLLGALVLALGFALLPLLTPGALGTGAATVPAIASPLERALSFAVIVVVCGTYCAGLWSGSRRTLPMKTWRLRLATARGEPVGVGRALARYLAWWIGPAVALLAAIGVLRSNHPLWSLTLLGANYAWALVDPDRQFLHDRIAGTRLVAEASG
jgi:uncharacterized RDD family membrane protein YckC